MENQDRHGSVSVTLELEGGLAAAARERRGSTRLQLNGLVAVLDEP